MGTETPAAEPEVLPEDMPHEEYAKFVEERSKGPEKRDRDGKLKAILFVSELPYDREKHKLRWLLEMRTFSIRSNNAYELVDDAVFNAEEAARFLGVKIVARMPVFRPDYYLDPLAKPARRKLVRASRALLLE